MPLKNLHKIEMPREKLIKYGSGKLKDEELLAILLRTGPAGIGVMNLAKKLLKEYKGTSLANATVKELIQTKGLAEAKACEIVACFELGRRLLKDKQTALVLSPKDVWEQCKGIRGSKKEAHPERVHPREGFLKLSIKDSLDTLRKTSSPYSDCTTSVASSSFLTTKNLTLPVLTANTTK